jgi:hypothetical protein
MKRLGDTLIEGADGRRIGWEVRLSSIDERGLLGVRAAKAAKNGITPAWHTDRAAYAHRSDTHWTRSDRLPAHAIARTGGLRIVSGLNEKPTKADERMGGLMSYGQFLAKGTGEGTPPFWIIAIALVVIVGVAFLVSKARNKWHHPRDTERVARAARLISYPSDDALTAQRARSQGWDTATRPAL